MLRRFALLLLLVVLTSPAIAQIAGTRWFPIGPSPIDGYFPGGVTGRTTAIAVNPTDSNQIWIGTAAGGVWHTIDGGANWVPLSDKEDALAIGAIAVDDCFSTFTCTVYAGTGENAVRRDTYYGRGLLVGQSSGFAATWQLRTGTPFDFSFGSINDVVLDPTTVGRDKRIFITLSTGVTAASPESTVTAPAPSGGVGIYRSDNDGMTWQKLNVTGAGTALPTDLKMDPNNHDVLFAGFSGRGVFRSTDGGNSWCPLNQGIAAPFGCPVQTLPDVGKLTFDHVEIAIAPGFSRMRYATFGLCADRLWEDCRPAVWMSSDLGVTWSQRNTGNGTYPHPLDNIAFAYSRYTHALAVDPRFDNDLLLGGLNLWSSFDAGATFKQSDHNLFPPDPLHSSTTIHPDHHDILFPDSYSGLVYDANDGGFAVSIDRGANWFPRNGGLQITEFQGIGSSALTTAPMLIGAAQDNAAGLWIGGSHWLFLPTYGDGGFAFLDADDVMSMYAGSNFGSILRSQDGGAHWLNAASPVWSSDPRSFYAVFVQAPTPDSSGKHPIYYASNRLFRSQDGATSWTVVSPVLATGSAVGLITAPGAVAHVADPSAAKNVITAVGIAPSDPTRIYVGYYIGQVFRTQKGGTVPCPSDDMSCWTSARTGLPLAPITRIAVDPTNPDVAYATVSGFGEFAHVWKTVNAGGSWTPIVSGLPAGVPANTISIEPSAPQNVWLGLDSAPGGASLFKSTNGGASWSPFAGGLPNAPVYEISIDEKHRLVFAGTHGRGAYVLGDAFISNSESWSGDRVRDLSLSGQNFPANKPCTVQLLQSNGRVCASGGVDMMGGAIATNAGGVMRTSLDVVWACLDGTCIGGVPAGSCYADAPLSRVAVTCGEQTATTNVIAGAPLNHPPSSAIEVAGGDAAGVLQITAAADASLCTVAVPFHPGDVEDATLTRAAEAVNASATCATNHVGAFVDHGLGGSGEDEFARRPRLLLEAKGVTGRQLIAGMHLDAGSGTGSAIRVDGIGVPVLGQLKALKFDVTTLPGGAAGGGTLTITEDSPLGTSSITIPTVAGQTKADIAQAIVSAVHAADRNPRDIAIRDGALVSVFAHALELRTTDPKVGFDVRAAELANAHPVANAGSDFAVVAGTPVLLDGSRSSDPDSTPATHDDVTKFEWFDVTASTPQLLGSAETLTVPLAPGRHRIRLRVTDRGGLSDTAEIVVSVGSQLLR